jgi:hypothetical protein
LGEAIMPNPLSPLIQDLLGQTPPSSLGGPYNRGEDLGIPPAAIEKLFEYLIDQHPSNRPEINPYAPGYDEGAARDRRLKESYDQAVREVGRGDVTPGDDLRMPGEPPRPRGEDEPLILGDDPPFYGDRGPWAPTKRKHHRLFRQGAEPGAYSPQGQAQQELIEALLGFRDTNPINEAALPRSGFSGVVAKFPR